MRAARIHHYGPPEVLQVERVEPPACGPQDVLIEVHASSVNPVDCKIRAGYQRGVIRYRLPWTLGLDVSGVVREVGSRVTGFQVGDEVVSSPTHRRAGTYAEYVAVAAGQVAKKPARLSHAEAASLPLVALTAWEALARYGRLQPGQRVLIQAGSGGVGSIAIQLARHLGASEIITTTSTRNVALCASLGATRVIDYTAEDYRALTGLDVVLDSLGGADQRAALKVLRPGGALASIVAGIPEATQAYGPNLGVVVAGMKMVWFSLSARLRGRRSANVMRRSDGATLSKLCGLAEAGVIRPLIDREFPLDDIAAAHRYSETGRARGKVVIRVR